MGAELPALFTNYENCRHRTDFLSRRIQDGGLSMLHESQSSSLNVESTGGNGENFHITLDSG